ncbi:AciT family ciprofloxacin tolerance protein [Acinetobacter tianfuensis]|uniref:Uncharacterized protein n=1 Tax=Acinetobacter tianfuensis TaxID=2419603 RepID=A0A3A8EJD8_9GAMM|nr:AciT family ciprofloxacin tolerance protein [Acinetobacter tianfuensis]RKG30104.1 hypothetical protein D7V32_12480 [Acinetobacter tianfuensis]
MVTANFATILGLSLVAAAVIAVFFSPYRRWLNYMFAGMLAWGMIEVIRFGAQAVFELPMAYSYLVALMSAMAVFILMLFAEDRRAEQRAAKRRYIEHTPVYEDDQQQFSSR